MNEKQSLHTAGRKVTATLAALQEPSLPTDNHQLKIPSLWIRGHYFYCDGEAPEFSSCRAQASVAQSFLVGKKLPPEP